MIMRAATAFFLSLLFCFSAAAQLPAPKTAPGTQGAAEAQQAAQLFEKEYHPQTFALYDGPVVARGDTFYYAHGTFTVIGISRELRQIFSRGLLDPSLVNSFEMFRSGDTLMVRQTDTAVLSNLEELPELSPSVRQRRFRFWLHRRGLANPQVCFFELTNEAADAQTDLAAFILHARLTFYIQAWIVI